MAFRALIIVMMSTAVYCNGCDRTYTAESGTIRSPGSPNYPNSADCTYTIKGSSRYRTVAFTFESFRLESCCDYLNIGGEKYNGVALKGKQLNQTFSKSFKLRFTSDGSATFSGFVIKYKLLAEPCPKGLYGENCTDECADGCKPDTCEWRDGACDCKPGWHGKKCDKECKNGYFGLGCSSSCSSGCSDVCNPETGRCACTAGRTGAKCDSSCPSGTYDSYCTKSCSPGCVNGSCSKEDGSCSCKSGYQGSRCNRGCSDIFYGPGCTQLCSGGCDSFFCDGVTGFCKCRPGWTGEKCNQECPVGLFGLNCSESCSPGCADTCSHLDGKCTCKPGWELERCDAECPADRHGVNCESSCSPGCEDGACDSESGLCTCTAGWMGEKCLEECENTTYGAYCKHTCSDGCVNDTCNAVNGTCSCVNWYLGDRCSFNMIVIASVSVGVVAAIMIPAFAFFLITRKRKKRKEDSVLEKTTKISDALTMKNITRESGEGNEYVGYDDDVIYVDPMDGEEDEYENFSYSNGQKSVSEAARNTDKANEESLYGNVHITGNSGRVGGRVAYHSGRDDVEEELEYENVEPGRWNRNWTKRPR